MQILLIDNNDSFTYNIAQLVQQTGIGIPDIIRYEDLTLYKFKQYDKIIISPGPGLPSDYPKYTDWLSCASSKSILGICMGHEIIAMRFGAKLIKLNTVRHGVMERMRVLDKTDRLFHNLSSGFDAGLYHSWVVSDEGFPAVLRITACDSRDTIMALSHKQFDLKGVQFHPESFMTKPGFKMLKNWLD